MTLYPLIIEKNIEKMLQKDEKSRFMLCCNTG
jgi:hypothetical protein